MQLDQKRVVPALYTGLYIRASAKYPNSGSACRDFRLGGFRLHWRGLCASILRRLWGEGVREFVNPPPPLMQTANRFARIWEIKGGQQVAKLLDYEKSAAADQWISDESAEQEERYQEIVKEMDDLGPERDVWVEKFFERIQTRGFNVHYNNRRAIAADELPTRPARKFKVVF